MSTICLKIKHGVTLYHYRNRGSTSLFTCSCGWHPLWVRRIKLRGWLRSLRCLGRHDWGESYDLLTGPVGFHEGDEGVYSLGSMSQCGRCGKIDSSREGLS